MAAEQTKVKKKKWVTILAPSLFKDIPIGETPVFEPKKLVGKKMSYNLMNLTNDPKKQQVTIKLEITDADDTKAKTQLIGYEIIQSHLRRYMRPGRERIDMSFVVKTEDSKYVILKPFLLTVAKTKTSVLTALRHKCLETAADYASKTTFESLATDIITGKFQKLLRDHLSKVYPLKTCELRVMETLTIAQYSKLKTKKMQKEEKAEQKPEEAPQEKSEESLAAEATA